MAGGERGGPAGRVGRRAARQGARRRRRGRRGDLPRRRLGHRRRLRTVRRRAGRHRRHARRAAPRRRPGPQPLARRAVRRQPRAAGRASPSCRSSSTSTPPSPRSAGPTPRGCAAASSSRRCGSPTSRTTTRGTTRCGRCARSWRCRCTCTRASPTAPPTAPTSGSSPPRPASGRRGRCGSSSGRACSSGSRACASASPSAARSGSTTCCGGWTSCTSATTARASSATQLTANMSMRPSEYFDRNCFIGASNIVRVEMARRYEIGVQNLCWGNDFPHPEGTWPHTREFLANVFCDIPHDETAAMLGTNAAEVYGFDADALQPLVDRIGPTPDELGQTEDPTAKWADAKRAGRPWLTGIETWPTATAARRDAPPPARSGSTRSIRRSSPRPTSSYAVLRDEDPVHWSDLLWGWVITRFDDVAAVLRDPSMSSDIQQRHADADRRARARRPGRARAGDAARSCTSTIPTTPGSASSWPSRSGSGRSTGSATLVDDRVAAALDRLRAGRRPDGDHRPRRRPRLPAAGRDLLRVARHARGGDPAVPVLDELGGPQPRPDAARRARRVLRGPRRHARLPRGPGRGEAAGAAGDLLSYLVHAEDDGDCSPTTS